MAKELKWREAIEKVLNESAEPLHYRDITERIISDGLRKSLGATPDASVAAIISGSIKNEGAKSPYLRVTMGTFTLKSKAGAPASPQSVAPGVSESEESEAQYEIISSFGMFWRRQAAEWRVKPRLLGMQRTGATPVDFCDQLGIYLLYDGREVIYVGRTTDRPLGSRLYEHTIDRLSERWDRFSWFGVLPVSEEGALGSLPAQLEAGKLLPAMEAVLIEALEPRQNRKRGDDLGAVEYADPIFTPRHVFQGHAPPPCLEAPDANNDARLNLTDGVSLLRDLFDVRPPLPPPPAPPGPEACGPAPDPPGSARHPGCRRCEHCA